MKLKILQFPIKNTGGGITQYVLNNWKYIDKTKFHFDFATISDSRLDFESELTSHGCKIHYISCSAEDNMNQFVKEFRAILAYGYDAIHLHTCFWKSFVVEELAIEKDVPVIIVHSHSNDLGGISTKINRKKALLTHNVLKTQFNVKLATHFCACSNAAAEWLFGEQIPRERVKILANAIDVDKYSFNLEIRNNYKHKLGLVNNFLIGHVGRFEYEKNHTFLIDVFCEISKKISNAKLLLIGTGTLFESMKNKIDSLDLSKKILLLGKRTDVAQLYQAIDMFVLPSHFEGLGIVLVEAQAAGLQCIASNYVPEDVNVTEKVSFLPLNIDDWCNEIIDKMKNTVRADNSELIKAKGFDIYTQIKELEKLYQGYEE